MERLIAVQDWAKHNLPRYAYGICKIFVQCRLVGGAFRENAETTESGWFGPQELPDLATEKTTADQIALCFEASRAEHWVTRFD